MEMIRNNHIGICCFSAKHITLRSKSEDWLAQNKNDVSEWRNMSTRGLLCYILQALTFSLTCPFGQLTKQSSCPT